jgi:outer membrane protein assembly factor BamB
MKLNSQGAVLWQKTYTNKKNQLIFSAVATGDGGLIFVGSTGGIKRPNVMLAWVVRLNAEGNALWQKKYNHEIEYLVRATAVATTADGGSVVGGYSITQPLFAIRFWSAWALKLDTNGVRQWQRDLRNRYTYDTIDLSGIRQEKDGHILLMGTNGEYPNGAHAVIWTAKLDSAGNMFWDETFGKSGVTSFDLTAIHDTRNDGTVFTGTRIKESAMDGLIAKTSSDGMVCDAFLSDTSLDLFSPGAVFKENTTHAKIKQSTFVQRTLYITRAPVHVEIIDLCAGK